MHNGMDKISAAAEKRYPEAAAAARGAAEEVKDKLAETAESIAETARENYDAAKEKAAETMQQGKELMNEARTEVSRAANDLLVVVADNIANAVKTRPVTSIGLAVLAGVVIGAMTRR